MKNKTEQHRRKIIQYLENAGTRGINSKFLINEITPRYSARLFELKKQGYKFRKVREDISGSNFDRIWLAYNPKTGISYAESNDRNRKVLSIKPKYRYEFNKEEQKYYAYPI